MISWVLYVYLSLRFSSIHWLTLWDPRLVHLFLSLSLSLFTCRMEALGWRTWTFMISVFCLEWLRCEWFSIALFIDFDSSCCNVTSSLTPWAFSYTPYAYLKCEIALVLTWSPSMYYNYSILYLASCAAWFIHRLWSVPVRLYLFRSLAW
jgi:hypothetical protein